MITLIIYLAFIGVLVWAVTTYIPMPQPIKIAIYIVAAICVLVLLMNAFGISDMPVPKIQTP